MHGLQKQKEYVLANDCFLVPLHLQFVQKTSTFLGPFGYSPKGLNMRGWELCDFYQPCDPSGQ